jgi:hypothetical protein
LSGCARAPQLSRGVMQTVKRLEMKGRAVWTVVPVVFMLTTGAISSEPGATRRLCLGAAPTPTAGPKSLANATGGLPDVQYTVQVDDSQPVELSRSKGQWVPNLATDKSHLVVIRTGAKRVASFHFRFPSAAGAELCLFLAPLYETWQVWPDNRCPWCTCDEFQVTQLHNYGLQPTDGAPSSGASCPSGRLHAACG